MKDLMNRIIERIEQVITTTDTKVVRSEFDIGYNCGVRDLRDKVQYELDKIKNQGNFDDKLPHKNE